MSKKTRFLRTLRIHYSRMFIGLGIVITMLCLYVWQPSLLQQADRLIYDIFLRANVGGKASDTPAIIDLDEQSLEEFGQWPWPRHLVAKLLAILTEDQAAAIGLDILLAEPDNSSVINLKKSFQRHFGIDISLDNIPSNLHDNDRILASIISQTPTVLGIYSRFHGDNVPLPKDIKPMEGIIERTAAGGLSPRTHLIEGCGITLPIPIIRTVAPLGMLNIAPDPDGIIRSIPLISQVDGRIFITLGLRTIMRALGINNLILMGGVDGLQALRLGKYTIPVTPNGCMMVPFRGGRGYYPTFRASDILNGKIPKSEIQGRIFIVGTSAPGLLDIRATPFDPVYPGVETHATVIDAVLSNNFIEVPPWAAGAQILSMVCLGILGIFIFSFTPSIVYLPILLSLIASSIWGSTYIFKQGTYFSPLYTILCLIALAITLLAVRFWQESKQRKVLRNAFSRYIAPDMVAQIMDKGEAVLAGEERIVTLMFTDIRGFTTMSEGLTPEQVVGALNRYFTPMTAIIRSSQGTVDKFIGDAIMAFWNAPLDVPMHPLQAVKSAMQMQNSLKQLNIELEQEMGINFRMGVGVHTGKVYVGNMGSAELLDYTCIGDTVNLTSRLEGLCPVYGVDVVTSAYTALLCQEYTQEDIPYFLPLDAIRVKGKKEPVEICSPITQQDKLRRETEIADFLQAREYYVKGDFHKSLQKFTSLHKEFADSILYSLYLERSQELSLNPPKDWAGVWTFTKK